MQRVQHIDHEGEESHWAMWTAAGLLGAAALAGAGYMAWRMRHKETRLEVLKAKAERALMAIRR